MKAFGKEEAGSTAEYKLLRDGTKPVFDLQYEYYSFNFMKISTILHPLLFEG
jgi:hypothetical protein